MASVVSCAPEPIAGEDYRLVFEDNFDGTRLDPNVWAIAPHGKPLPVTVGYGVAAIKSTAANDYHWGYLASTGPRSSGEPSYPKMRAWKEGYFEARIRYTQNAWVWPAFWLASKATSEAWPGENCYFLASEWDIMENGNGGDPSRPPESRYNTTLHRNTSDGADGYCNQPDTMRHASRDFFANLSDWHVWGGRWTANQLCTYLDGIEIQCMAPYDSTSQFMHLIFSMQYLRECNGCPARPSKMEMQVDWVRVWQK